MPIAAADVTFRQAAGTDHSLCVALMAELVAEISPADDAERITTLLPDDLHQALHSNAVCIFLAEQGNTLVGLSRGDILTKDPIFRLRDDHRCGYIDQMYVRANFRDRGVGEALLTHCENWFRQAGIRHVLLHAAPKAARFYARIGYLPNREMYKQL